MCYLFVIKDTFAISISLIFAMNMKKKKNKTFKHAKILG
jgi:hypothetical protein